jgi:hypothetical protein
MAPARPKTAKERWVGLAERVVPLLLTIMVPLAGGLWAVYLYLGNQRDVSTKQAIEQSAQSRARFLELQRPFIDKQFATYNEFVKVIGDLLTPYAAYTEWRDVVDAYWKLHWSGVALFEDDEVHQTKTQFGKTLVEFTDKFRANERRILQIATDLSDKEKTEQERDKLRKEQEALELEVVRLRHVLEEASVPLTTALRRSMQNSWGGGSGCCR